MPEETAQAFRDGWMHTGDLATIDAGGFITIVDRKKDIIISGRHQRARAVRWRRCCCATPTSARRRSSACPTRGGARPSTPSWWRRRASTVDTDAVLAHCAAALADYKRPRSIEVRDELPISGTGKVLKRVLREPYWPAREAT